MQHAILALLHLCLLLLANVAASPMPLVRRETSIVPRAEGDATGAPMVVTTTDTIQTSNGPASEVCTITFTPIAGANGESLVRMEKSCVVTLLGSSTTSSSGQTSTVTSSSATASVTDVIVNGASSIAASAFTATASATSAATSTSTGTAVTSTATSTGEPSAGSVSSIDVAAASSLLSGISVSTTATPSAVGNAASGASGTSAADSAASSTAAAFQLPGQKLSVLPIGLGVFAGVSVIALIVVGLVTYERTKYRKAFRQRKLAESGAGMGYGGMAQRT